MTDDTTTQLANDDEATASQVVDATFDLTQDGDGVDDSEAERPWLRPGKWYVVHSQSGYEKKVDANLKARIASYNLDDRFNVFFCHDEFLSCEFLVRASRLG